MYIWQHTDWPHFHWHGESLRARLDSVRLLQGRLLGRTEAAPEQTDLEVEMDALIQNAIRTSEPESDSLVELLLEATHQPDEALSRKQLCRWQAMRFPRGTGLLTDMRVGELRGEAPMQVASGRVDHPNIHFEARRLRYNPLAGVVSRHTGRVLTAGTSAYPGYCPKQGSGSSTRPPCSMNGRSRS